MLWCRQIAAFAALHVSPQESAPACKPIRCALCFFLPRAYAAPVRGRLALRSSLSPLYQRPLSKLGKPLAPSLRLALLRAAISQALALV